uniref:Uncharacterized protein n=1 Tax=Timema shepardi TaxID=629360 RepID=A0A7R9B9R4_TIMSH|nr:unnamed protein product [Timema shepardi]
MPDCCFQVGLRAVAKTGLVVAIRWGMLLLPANERLLLSGGAGWCCQQIPGCCYQVALRAEAKAGLVAATRWGWLLLPANPSLLLSGGAEDRGQGGPGGTD